MNTTIDRAPVPKPSENPLRLRFRAPTYHGGIVGGPDDMRVGVERALQLATERARRTGQRQVVTVSPYSRIRNAGGPAMRVQAWR